MKRRAWLRRDARSKVVAAEEADYSSCSCHEVRWRARLMTQLKQLLRRGPRRAQKSLGPTRRPSPKRVAFSCTLIDARTLYFRALAAGSFACRHRSSLAWLWFHLLPLLTFVCALILARSFFASPRVNVALTPGRCRGRRRRRARLTSCAWCVASAGSRLLSAAAFASRLARAVRCAAAARVAHGAPAPLPRHASSRARSCCAR